MPHSTHKLKIIIVEGHHPRHRSKFVKEPLKCFENLEILSFQFTSNLLLSVLRSFWMAVTNFDVDVIMSCDTGVCGLFWFICSKCLGNCAFVLRLGGNPEKSIIDASGKRAKNELSLYLKIKILIDNFVIKRIRHLIVVSPNLVTELSDLLHLDCKTYIIPQPVFKQEISDWQQPPKTVINLLTVTNLNFFSKYSSIVLAINQLINDSSLLTVPVKWRICGGGHFLPKIRDFVNSLECTESISVLVEGHQQNTSNFYQNADIFIYTSYLDGLPSVVLEALSYALPVIINRELTENIDSSTIAKCFLFDLNSPGSLVNTLNSLIVDTDHRLQSGIVGRDFVLNEYSLDAVGRKLCATLQSIKN